MTLDGILGRFERVKTDLTYFIGRTDHDIATLKQNKKQLKEQIRANKAVTTYQKAEKKRANKALKQITKLTGGKV